MNRRYVSLLALVAAVVAAGLAATVRTAAAQVPDNPDPPFVRRPGGPPATRRSPSSTTIVKGAKVHERPVQALPEGRQRSTPRSGRTSSTSRTCSARSPSPAAAAWAATRSTSTSSGCCCSSASATRSTSSAATSASRPRPARRSPRPSRRPTPTRSCMSLRIAGHQPDARQGVLINLNDIFMTDFAQLGIGYVRRQPQHLAQGQGVPARTSSCRCRPPTPAAGRRRRRQRHRRPRQHRRHPLRPVPSCPTAATSRASPTTASATSSASSRTSPATARTPPFVRYVNRWRLERAERLDPEEARQARRRRRRRSSSGSRRSVPDEYRGCGPRGHPRVEQGVREDRLPRRHRGRASRRDEDFDPEDINYNTFRWITTDRGFAMGPSRANPLTGEILDADIIFDAGMVRCWKHERQVLRQRRHGVRAGQPDPGDGRTGWGLDHQLLQPRPATARLERPAEAARRRPGRGAGCAAIRQGVCQCGAAPEARAGPGRRMAMARRATPAQAAASKVPEELIGQAIKEVDDARGRPHARPAAQLQGQHDARERAAARHRRSPARRAWSAR